MISSTTRPAILLVEQDSTLRRRVHGVLIAGGLGVMDGAALGEGFGHPPEEMPDLVIMGTCAGGPWAALEQAGRVRGWGGDIPIILITPESSERLAVAALKAGIMDYFTHPVPLDEVMASIRRCLATRAPGRPSRSGDVHGLANPRWIGTEPRMREIGAHIESLAASESTVLITGETGTGKELVATLIHDASRRRHKPLVCVNCAAIPDGLLESELFGYERGAFTGAYGSSPGKLKLAEGGTVFFDEIGDMTLYGQAKVLRVIERKEIERLGGRRSVPVDVRIIAATNQDLDQMMAEGRFRKDLYFRLNVARVHLPPLRERKEDLPALLDHYARELSREPGRRMDGVTDEALAALAAHEWPGNVRELRNLVEAILPTLRSPRIALRDLPIQYRRPAAPDATGQQTERDRLLAALLATKWNKSRAAERLHWSRMTVYRKIAKYQLGSALPASGASRLAERSGNADTPHPGSVTVDVAM